MHEVKKTSSFYKIDVIWKVYKYRFMLNIPSNYVRQLVSLTQRKDTRENGKILNLRYVITID